MQGTSAIGTSSSSLEEPLIAVPAEPQLISVVAPADLMEGYTFDATVNGKVVSVTVVSLFILASASSSILASSELQSNNMMHVIFKFALNFIH